jgi:hypothetical protein
VSFQSNPNSKNYKPCVMKRQTPKSMCNPTMTTIARTNQIGRGAKGETLVTQFRTEGNVSREPPPGNTSPQKACNCD